MCIEPNSVLLSVRPMEQGDLRQVWAWRNEWRVRRYMFNQGEIEWDDHVAWFQRALQNTGKHLLVLRSERSAVGFVQFSSNAQNPNVAEWGFYKAGLAPKGSGKSICSAALDYGFRKLGLHKVSGRVIAYNKPSIQLHEYLGFQLEGILRDSYFDGQNYHAVHCFGLLESEWLR